jgi:hypothetical protein
VKLEEMVFLSCLNVRHEVVPVHSFRINFVCFMLLIAVLPSWTLAQGASVVRLDCDIAEFRDETKHLQVTYFVDVDGARVGSNESGGIIWYSAMFDDNVVRWEDSKFHFGVDRTTLHIGIANVATSHLAFTGQCRKSEAQLAPRQF